MRYIRETMPPSQSPGTALMVEPDNTSLPRSLIHLREHLGKAISQHLWLQVLIGMGLGVAFGVALGPSAGWVDEDTAEVIGNWIALPGKLFLTAVQFVVVPLVVASVIRGIAAGEGTHSLGRVGGIAVGYFLLTTVVAVVIGLALAALLAPGRYFQGESLMHGATTSSAPPVFTAAPGISSPTA